MKNINSLTVPNSLDLEMAIVWGTWLGEVCFKLKGPKGYRERNAIFLYWVNVLEREENGQEKSILFIYKLVSETQVRMSLPLVFPEEFGYISKLPTKAHSTDFSTYIERHRKVIWEIIWVKYKPKIVSRKRCNYSTNHTLSQNDGRIIHNQI